MKSLFLIATLFMTTTAFATVIELEVGNSVNIKAGDSATVTCTGSGSVGNENIGSINAFCANINQLIIELDTDVASTSETIDLLNSSTCKNALSQIKNKTGSFTGVKTLMFCNSNELIKVRISATTGKITKTVTSMLNSTECQNAL